MKTEQTTLDKIRTRPRFKIYTTLSREEFESHLKEDLQKSSDEFEGNVNREGAIISVKSTDNPYWKPTLSLRSELNENENTIIRGVFGPTSAVWTFFMFLYFVWSILWMVFITLWFVGKQIKTDEYSWGLLWSFIILGVGFATYLAAKIGQKLAKKEMNQLRNFAVDFVSIHEKKEV